MTDIRKMEVVYEIKEGTFPHNTDSNISISSDKKYFAVGSTKGSIYIVNTLTGTVLMNYLIINFLVGGYYW